MKTWRVGAVDVGLTVSARGELEALRGGLRAVCISYPKSGRTWLRCILGSYAKRIEEDPLRVAFTHDGADGKGDPSRDSGDPLEARRWYSAYRVILLLRDPRDVVVSNYFQVTRRDPRFGQPRPSEIGTVYPIGDFIRRDDLGIRSVIRYYNLWHAIWISPFGPEPRIVLSYEQLHAAPMETIRRVLKVLGMPLVKRQLFAALDDSKFDRLREIEETNPTEMEMLRPADRHDVESYKTRRGLVGGHVDYLSAADVGFMQSEIELRLNPEVARMWRPTLP